MTSATYTILPVISGSESGYGYGNTAPTIIIENAVPSTKIGDTEVIQYFTITDDTGITSADVLLSAGSPATISNINVIDSKNLIVEVTVSASGDIGLSATDNGGLTSTTIVEDFVLGVNLSTTDVFPPAIKFTNHDTSDRFIIDTGTTGSVHVTVTDDVEVTYDFLYPEKYIRLTDDSVGTIDPTSWVQTTSAKVEFDVINISATGYVGVSATDYWAGISNIETDGKWNVSCPDNDRLINLVDFLPQHLYDSETYDFIKFFENFLNTMYEDKDNPCNYSILKKIEQIGDLHDPNLMDSEYLQFFADLLGYDISLTRGEIGFISNEVVNDGSFLDDEDSRKYMRFVVENLPNWYKIKSTRNAVKIMLFSFGVIGDLFNMFTNDYDQNWLPERPNDYLSVNGEIPDNWYPTPHFKIGIDLRETTPSWLVNLEDIVNAVNTIRPINTVFNHIGGYYTLDPSLIDVQASSPNATLHYTIEWTNSTATCATGDLYTNMYSDGSDGNQTY